MAKTLKALSTFLVRERYTVEVSRHVKGLNLADAISCAEDDEGYEAIKRYATNITLEDRITETT